MNFKKYMLKLKVFLWLTVKWCGEIWSYVGICVYFIKKYLMEQ